MTDRAMKTIPTTAARAAFRAARLCPDGNPAHATTRFAFPMHAKICTISKYHRASGNASPIHIHAAAPVAINAGDHRYARAERAKPNAMPQKRYAPIHRAIRIAQICRHRTKTAVRAAIYALSPIMPSMPIARTGLALSIAQAVIMNTTTVAKKTI